MKNKKPPQLGAVFLYTSFFQPFSKLKFTFTGVGYCGEISSHTISNNFSENFCGYTFCGCKIAKRDVSR